MRETVCSCVRSGRACKLSRMRVAEAKIGFGSSLQANNYKVSDVFT
jgi:hypothetical protein